MIQKLSLTNCINATYNDMQQFYTRSFETINERVEAYEIYQIHETTCDSSEKTTKPFQENIHEAIQSFEKAGTDLLALIEWRESHMQLLSYIHPKMDADIDVDTMLLFFNEYVK